MPPANPSFRTVRDAFIEQYCDLPGLSSLKNEKQWKCHPADDHIWIAASYLDKMGMFLPGRDFGLEYRTAVSFWEICMGGRAIFPSLAKAQGIMLATNIMYATGGKAVVHAFFESNKWTSGQDLANARAYAQGLEENRLRDADYKDFAAVDAVIHDVNEASSRNVEDQGAVDVGESGFSADNGQPLNTSVKSRWNKLKSFVKKR